MFFASLRLPANSRISLNTAPHLPLTLGLTPPLIKDTAEPPGWLVLIRGLVEPAQLKKRNTQKVPILAAFERQAEESKCNDCH